MIRSFALLTLMYAIPMAAQVQRPDSTITPSFAGMRVISLHNGPNRIDLDGDGRVDEVFVGRRENFNAHDFSVYTFYASYPSSYMPGINWHVVPFFPQNEGEERDALTTSEGADCTLGIVLVVQDTTKHPSPVEVLVGARVFGATFATRDTVHFTLYTLEHNDGGPGRPTLSFEAQRTITPSKLYCDVNRAAVDGLGLHLPRTASQ